MFVLSLFPPTICCHISQDPIPHLSRLQYNTCPGSIPHLPCNPAATSSQDPILNEMFHTQAPPSVHTGCIQPKPQAASSFHNCTHNNSRLASEPPISTRHRVSRIAHSGEQAPRISHSGVHAPGISHSGVHAPEPQHSFSGISSPPTPASMRSDLNILSQAFQALLLRRPCAQYLTDPFKALL